MDSPLGRDIVIAGSRQPPFFLLEVFDYAITFESAAVRISTAIESTVRPYSLCFWADTCPKLEESMSCLAREEFEQKVIFFLYLTENSAQFSL